MKSINMVSGIGEKENVLTIIDSRIVQNIITWCRIKYIKLFNWEYWPMWLVYLPVGFYYIFLSIKARSFFFFSAANPSIETGGMFFESKWDIFKLIPKEYYPVTVFTSGNENLDVVIQKMNESGLDFPLIAKPDRGERGWCVEILKDMNGLKNYIQKCPINFLLQQYIELPVEMSIFYYRHPEEQKGRITSVTFKEYLNVIGNGISTVEELIKMNDRAFLQLEKLRSVQPADLNKILLKGENQVLVPFGNHVRGAMFLDYNHIVDETLTTLFDNISKQITGFYFGRFDIKCKSIEDLRKGNLSILELNGSGAEPAHIYQPGFSFFQAQTVLAAHYKMMYDAAKSNHSKGTSYMTLASYRETKAREKQYKARVLSL